MEPRSLTYATALGALATIAGAWIPPELQFLFNGIGINLVSSMIDRVSKGEQLSDDEIQHRIEAAVSETRIDRLLTENHLLAAGNFTDTLTKLVNSQVVGTEYLRKNDIELRKLSDQLASLVKMLGRISAITSL